VIAYRAVLDVPRELVRHLAGLLAAERRRRGHPEEDQGSDLLVSCSARARLVPQRRSRGWAPYGVCAVVSAAGAVAVSGVKDPPVGRSQGGMERPCGRRAALVACAPRVVISRSRAHVRLPGPLRHHVADVLHHVHRASRRTSPLDSRAACGRARPRSGSRCRGRDWRYTGRGAEAGAA
jgi:hypothetical protein